MPAAKKLILNEKQRQGLEAWTKNPPKPYLRRKAWALLLVAQGKAVYQAAQDRRVHANRVTVSNWIQKFEAQGLEGLKQAKGQGRKPSFFPSPQERSAKGSSHPFTHQSEAVWHPAKPLATTRRAPSLRLVGRL